MKSKMLFVDLRQERVRTIVTSIETASDLKIASTATSGLDPDSHENLEDCLAVFISRDLKESRLVQVLDFLSENHPEIPVVLTYGAELDGRAYLYARKYDCLLFSEKDRFGRTLTAGELAEALQKRSPQSDVTRKLMELSMSCGPCSTGD